MKLELISSDRCPYVQRSVITLEYKHVAYTMTFIDPYQPPEWFSTLSPTGKVPMLRIDDDTVLFESAVINEYLDDITPGSLHPADPLQRARNRAWIEFGSGCLSALFRLMTAPDQSGFEAAEAELTAQLQRVEAALGEGPFFNGSEFALVDAAYAPLFVRLDLLCGMLGLSTLDTLPRLQLWRDALLDLPAVQKICTPILPQRFRELMHAKDAWALARLAT